jgi:hypothetical protein
MGRPSLYANYTFLDDGQLSTSSAYPATSMKTVTIKMTPELAVMFLEVRAPNRDITPRSLAAITCDMLAKAYELTHESIAFDKSGKLIDGQHRCQACVDSGVTVYQRVTYFPGSRIAVLIEEAIVEETSDLRIGAPIDRGTVRGIPGQLQIAHASAPDALSKAAWARRDAITRAIRFALANEDNANANQKHVVLPTHTALVVETTYSEYRTEIDWLINRSPARFSAAVGAIVALASTAWPEHMERFLTQLITGENIPTNGPAGRLRNQMMTLNPRSGSHGRLALMLRTSHAVLLFVDGRPLKGELRTGSHSLDRILAAREQAKRVAK